MPTVPVAYEAGPPRARATYESRVMSVLKTLGSENPEADVQATGPLLENSKKAKMDPTAAAGIIYATARHRHPPTSVLRTAESNEAYKRVTEYYRRPKTVAEVRPVTAAEDSSPAPCTKPARTVSDECQRIAKEIGPIKSDKELYALVAPQMRKEPQEVFYVVCCDVHGDLVGFTEVARGQVSRVAVDVEDVLGAVLAVRPRPTIYFVAHCHPSGKARPSEADEKLTEHIRRAGAVAMPNVVFGDHIIVGGGSSREYYSFSDKKLKKG
jgi:proteasome lid subunit RPN8/RPN11